MKNRYWVAGLCLLVLMLVLTSACGGGGSPTTSAITNTSPTTTTATTPVQTTTTSTATTTSAGEAGSISDILGRWSNTGSTKYDMIITTTGTPTVTVTIWQKNKKMREDMTAEGMTVTVLFDMDEGVIYTYTPSLNMAMKSTYTPSTLPQGSVVDTRIILDYNPNITGTETIDGKSCTVISYSMSGSSTKAWIWTETGFPLKIEMTSGGSTITMEYKNIDFSDIPDSAFELPADVTITEI